MKNKVFNRIKQFFIRIVGCWLFKYRFELSGFITGFTLALLTLNKSKYFEILLQLIRK